MSSPRALFYLKSPSLPYGDAWILANEAGLLALRSTIERALAHRFASRKVCTVQGESYVVWVIRADEPSQAELWRMAELLLREGALPPPEEDSFEDAPTLEMPSEKGPDK